MVRPAPIPRRSSHLGSAACPGRSDHGSHSSTSAASSRSNRRQGNHNRFPTLKMFPDGHLAQKNIGLAPSVAMYPASTQHIPNGLPVHPEDLLSTSQISSSMKPPHPLVQPIET